MATSKTLLKIIESGSPRSRIMLFFEEIARTSVGEKPKLTREEFSKLSDSLGGEKEEELHSLYVEINNLTVGAINNLQGLSYDVEANLTDVKGFLLLWEALEVNELSVNTILHQVKDIKERKSLATLGAKSMEAYRSTVKVDKEGYIEIDIKNYSSEKYAPLWDTLQDVKKHAEEAIIRLFTWERAILDYMERNKFNIKAYKDRIKQLTDRIRGRQIKLPKYSGNIAKKLSSPQLQEIGKYYLLAPDIEELSTKINKEEYNDITKALFYEDPEE